MPNNFHGFPSPIQHFKTGTVAHPLLLAITGKFGAGKSTASNYVVSKHKAKVLPFAQNLKLEVYDALNELDKSSVAATISVNGQAFGPVPIPKLVIPTDREKIAWINENKNTLRQLLQFWGTDYRRSQNLEYWVYTNVKHIQTAIEAGETAIVVDDMRYNNEAVALRNLGFTIVRIVVDQNERMQRVVERDGAANEQALNHPSETQQDNLAVDYHVENSGPIGNMYQKLDKIIIEVLNKQG